MQENSWESRLVLLDTPVCVLLLKMKATLDQGTLFYVQNEINIIIEIAPFMWKFNGVQHFKCLFI